MSQKKIKQEKREIKNMQEEQKNMGKWVASIIGIGLIGVGIYLMMGQNAIAPTVKKEASTNNTNTSTTTMDTTRNQNSQENNMNSEKKNHEFVIIETSKGTIKVELYPEDAPKTVANFVGLVNKNFYDGLTFHRVVPGFVVQGGDPKGTGMGGSDATIPLEIRCEDGIMTEGKIATCEPALKHLDGALAMARSSDPNSASSQFYITLGAQSFLDKNYAVFGYVVEGKDVASKIEMGDIMNKVYFQK